MKPAAKPREQLFERDLAAILSCDKGTAHTLPSARGRQLWLLPLLVAAFGGFAALSLQRQIEPTDRPAISRSAPPARSERPTVIENEPTRSVAESTPAVEVPAPRARVLSSSRERIRRADRRELVSYQKDQTSPLPTAGEGQDAEEATPNDPEMEKQLARDEKQRLARIEAMDAVRSLRLR